MNQIAKALALSDAGIKIEEVRLGVTKQDKVYREYHSFMATGTWFELPVSVYDRKETEIAVRIVNHTVYNIKTDGTPQDIVTQTENVLNSPVAKRLLEYKGVNYIKEHFIALLKQKLIEAGGKLQDDLTYTCSGIIRNCGSFTTTSINGDYIQVDIHGKQGNPPPWKDIRVNLLTDNLEERAKEVIRELKSLKQPPAPLRVRLNRLNLKPVISGTTVTHLVDKNGETLRKSEYERLGIDHNNIGTVERHPPTGANAAKVQDAYFNASTNQWE